MYVWWRPTLSVVFPLCYGWRTGSAVGARILLIPAAPIFIKHWHNFKGIRTGTEIRTSFIWNKKGELRRIGKWNETTEAQLERHNK